MFAAKAETQSQKNPVEHAFAAGGKVTLKPSSGDYTIRAGRSDRILVQCESRKQVDIGDIVRVSMHGSSATIRTDGPIKDTHFIIEIPARSDLQLDVRAGDVKISGIEGNKDVHMTAGDLDIDMTPGSYSRVQASVTFGDLDARSLRISKGGIARSLDWVGPGAYELRAHLFAGDITLFGGK